MKVLAVLVISFCALFNLVRCNAIRKTDNRNPDNNELVCTTPGCIKAAEIIKDNLDESVEPCHDFYKFACGGFMKKTAIPNDTGRVTYFDIIGGRIIKQLRDVFEEPVSPDDLASFRSLKKFYKLCTDTKAIEDDGLKTAKSLLQKLGGWPVVERTHWNEDAFEWNDMIYKFRRLGLPYNEVVNVYVGVNVLVTSKLMLEIDQPNLGLKREYLIQGMENNVVKAYYNYLVDIAIIFGAQKLAALKEIKDALDFEISLAKISLGNKDRLNLTTLTNLMTIEEMQERYPSIAWQEFFTNVVDDSAAKIIPSELINVAVPDYLEKLEKLLLQTPKRAQANMLIYRIITSSVRYLTQELKDRELQLNKVIKGVSEHRPKREECTVLTAEKLKFAAGALYIRRYFNEDTKQLADELVKNLKETFTEMLTQVDWMDESTRKKALEKVDAMNAVVGCPAELLDNKNLDAYYNELNATANTFLDFGMSLRKFSVDADFSELSQTFDRSNWLYSSLVASVDAYFYQLQNKIQLPAGILQSPLFSADRPNYLNYGSMGFAIGHEITHGFDNLGKQFDKNGAIDNWWEEETKQAFADRAQCFINQYGNYTAPEVNKNLNGLITLGENIADNGAVKEAYMAYEKWVRVNGHEPRLPNLKYSPNQLFWISVANLWCTGYKTEYLEQQILTDEHVPFNFRVLGPLRNSEIFAKDFNCSLGSEMNPVHKCYVW